MDTSFRCRNLQDLMEDEVREVDSHRMTIIDKAVEEEVSDTDQELAEEEPVTREAQWRVMREDFCLNQ